MVTTKKTTKEKAKTTKATKTAKATKTIKAKKTARATKAIKKPKTKKKVKAAETKVTKAAETAKTAKTARMAKPKKTVKTVKRAIKGIRYWEGVGRRKTAVARVRIFTRGEKEFLVNEKKLSNYFSISFLDEKAILPLKLLKLLDKFRITVKVRGGGVDAQAEAIRHGLSRALIKFNPNFRKKLKKAGFLTRDSRMKERKKFGLKRARRAPQWQKR